MQNQAKLYQMFMNYLESNAFQNKPHALYEPINYIMKLGGKRIRPILSLMAYQLFKDDVEFALPAALAIETFHNFSLVHDDIMDEAPLRRGKPTVHTKYDSNTAILSGDVMLIYVYEYLMQYATHPNLGKILKTFNEVAIKVCEGQQYDMDFETREDVQLSEYLKMIEYKTAYLLVGALKIGALLANADQKDVEHTAAFGRNIGIAFQIQDDILDSFGDPAKFGKKVGGDIIQNKKTYLVLKTLEQADENTKSTLQHIMSSTTTDEAAKIQEVKSIFQEWNIPQLAEQKKQDYQDQAFKHLAAIKVEQVRKDQLAQLAYALMGREN